VLTDGWKSRWVESTHKGSEAGIFGWTAGKFYGDAEEDKGEFIPTVWHFPPLSMAYISSVNSFICT
jgi:hypothetical protein